jgi:hypothetical protein
MRSLLVVLVSLAAALSSCGGVCSPTGPSVPTTVCITGAQPVAAGQAFTLRATNYAGGGGAATCTTGFDGGSLTLTLDGTACSGGFNQPIARAIPADCTVGPLPAGTYRFSNLGAELTLFDGGFSLDGGALTNCP